MECSPTFVTRLIESLLLKCDKLMCLSKIRKANALTSEIVSLTAEHRVHVLKDVDHRSTRALWQSSQAIPHLFLVKQAIMDLSSDFSAIISCIANIATDKEFQ
jgi:hypothetical protein